MVMENLRTLGVGVIGLIILLALGTQIFSTLKTSLYTVNTTTVNLSFVSTPGGGCTFGDGSGFGNFTSPAQGQARLLSFIMANETANSSINIFPWVGINATKDGFCARSNGTANAAGTWGPSVLSSYQLRFTYSADSGPSTMVDSGQSVIATTTTNWLSLMILAVCAGIVITIVVRVFRKD